MRASVRPDSQWGTDLFSPLICHAFSLASGEWLNSRQKARSWNVENVMTLTARSPVGPFAGSGNLEELTVTGFRAAKALSQGQVSRMSNAEVEETVTLVRWAATDGKPVCPSVGASMPTTLAAVMAHPGTAANSVRPISALQAGRYSPVTSCLSASAPPPFRASHNALKGKSMRRHPALSRQPGADGRASRPSVAPFERRIDIVARGKPRGGRQNRRHRNAPV